MPHGTGIVQVHATAGGWPRSNLIVGAGRSPAKAESEYGTARVAGYVAFP